MTDFGKKIKALSASLFGKGEVQSRMAKNTLKMILGDMVTLHDEFKKYKGTGALFFTPENPLKSSYVTINDLVNDKAVAEEMCDEGTGKFLEKLINILEKNKEAEHPVVVLCSEIGLSVHVLDLNETDEKIDKVADAAS